MGDRVLELLAEVDRKAAELDRLRHELRERLELERMFPELKGTGRVLLYYDAPPPYHTRLHTAVCLRDIGEARKCLPHTMLCIKDAETRAVLINRSLADCPDDIKRKGLRGLTGAADEVFNVVIRAVSSNKKV